MVLFVALSFAFTWTLQLVGVLAAVPPVVVLALFAVAAVVPSVVAAVMTRGSVVRELADGCPPWALGVGLLGPVALTLFAAGVLTFFGQGLPALRAPALVIMLLPAIGEELGWRGYLQPRATARYGLLWGSIVVGLAWAPWHLVASLGGLERFPLYAVRVVAASVIIGWLWDRAGRRVLVGVVAHAGINAQVLVWPASILADSVLTATWVGAASIAAVAMTKRRTHGPRLLPARRHPSAGHVTQS